MYTIKMNLIGKVVQFKNLGHAMEHLGEYAFDQWELITIEGNEALLRSLVTPNVTAKCQIDQIEGVDE